MQFLTLWTSLNYGLLRFNYSISIQHRLTACTWAQKSTPDDWLTSLRRLLCAFLERGLKMGSKEIQDVSDSNEKGENYQQALTVLNEAVDILRSPSMSSCQSITTATVGSQRSSSSSSSSSCSSSSSSSRSSSSNVIWLKIIGFPRSYRKENTVIAGYPRRKQLQLQTRMSHHKVF